MTTTIVAIAIRRADDINPERMVHMIEKLLLRLRMTLSVIVVGALLLPGFASAQALSDSAENIWIDHFVRGQAATWGGQTATFASAPTLYVALATTSGSDAACGTEVTGGNYARQPITASLANFAGTQGAGTTVASTGTSGATSNNAAVTWSSVTWSGTVVEYCVYSASTSGVLYWRAALTTSRTVASGDTVSFAIGAMTFTIGQFGEFLLTQAATHDEATKWAA